MSRTREEYSWPNEKETAVVSSPDGVAWWTFAGDRANAAIRQRMMELIGSNVRSDGFSVSVEDPVSPTTLSKAVEDIRQHNAKDLVVDVANDMLEGLKFTSCLPEQVAKGILRARLADQSALASAIAEPVRHVTVAV